jgi:hypothetical protein
MKKKAAIIVLISLILTACNQNKPASSQIPVVGEPIDSAAIASDTSEQENLESSYEYAQTVIVSPKLAYDVRAYGGPASRGEYCIIRRGVDNKGDTVVQGERSGIIVNAFTGDLNNNGKEEIYVVFQSADSILAESIAGYEFDSYGKVKPIKCLCEPESSWNYRGKDSIYLGGKIIISRLIPFFDKQNKQGGWLKVSYALNGDVLSKVSSAGFKEFKGTPYKN